MKRIHDNDMSGSLLQKGTEDLRFHLSDNHEIFAEVNPMVNEDDTQPFAGVRDGEICNREIYPGKLCHGIIEYGMPETCEFNTDGKFTILCPVCEWTG